MTATATPISAPKIAVTVAGVLAIASLASLSTLGGAQVFPAVLGAAMLLPYVTSARLRSASVWTWAVRLLVFAAVLLLTLVQPMPSAFAPLNPAYIHRIGLLAAAEMAVRAMSRDRSGRRDTIILALSGCVMCSSAVTVYAHTIVWFAPLWTIAVVFALEKSSRKLSSRENLLRVACLMLCVALGFSFYVTFKKFGRSVYSRFDQLARREWTERSSGTTTTGMSVRSELRTRFNLERSEIVVLRAQTRAKRLYLHGVAFDSYSVLGSWEPKLSRELLQVVTTQPTAVKEPDRPADGLRIERMNDPNGLLFLPAEATSVTVIDGGAISVVPRLGPAVVVMPYLLDDSTVDRTLYDVQVAKETDVSGYSISLDAATLRETIERCRTSPPQLDARIVSLAKTIAGEEKDPARLIARVVNYLRANHAYATQVDYDSKYTDPLASFLLERRPGHCQYFATAAAVMLRVLGVPTRFAQGYYVYEADANDPRTLLGREQDAHAWVEAWIDGRGWTVVDATPDDGRPDVLYRKGFWRRAYEAVAATWASLYESWTAGELWFVPVTLLCGALVYLLIRLQRRRTDRSRVRVVLRASDYDVAKDFEAFVVAFEAFLRSNKLGVPPARPWSEMLGDLPSPIRADVLELIRVYSAARFGLASSTSVADLVERLRRLQADKRNVVS